MKGETMGFRHPPWGDDAGKKAQPPAEDRGAALAMGLHVAVALQALCQIEAMVRGAPPTDLRRSEALSAVEVLGNRLQAIRAAAAAPPQFPEIDPG